MPRKNAKGLQNSNHETEAKCLKRERLGRVPTELLLLAHWSSYRIKEVRSGLHEPFTAVTEVHRTAS